MSQQPQPDVAHPLRHGSDDSTIWRHGVFQADIWRNAGADAPLGDGPVIVPKARWLAERDALLASQSPLGLRLEPGDGLDDLAADLSRFQVIALNFPKFSDGRAFSLARLLREKFGYTGELRAVGQVLNDQIPFMLRVGFDSLEVTHGPTRAALVSGHLAEVTLYYQPAEAKEAPAGTRPWLRQAGKAADAGAA